MSVYTTTILEILYKINSFSETKSLHCENYIKKRPKDHKILKRSAYEGRVSMKMNKKVQKERGKFRKAEAVLSTMG